MPGRSSGFAGRGLRLVLDMVSASADRFGAANNCGVYHDLKDMLADDAVDVVTICTPSGAHRDPAVAAADAGKHVVVEKPLEITLKRCDAIINACRKNKVKLCTIFPSRFSPANRALTAAIRSGRFGKLTLGDAYTKWWRTQEYYDSGGWRGTWGLGRRRGVHEPGHSQRRSVVLAHGRRGRSHRNDRHRRPQANRGGRHRRGNAAVQERGVGRHRGHNGCLPGLLKKIEIHGTEGTAIIEEDSILTWEFLRKRSNDGATRKKFAKTTSGGGASDPTAISYTGHMKQLKDFIKAIQTGCKPLVDGEEGRKSVEIILAIYKSAWTGRRVELPLKSDPKIPK